MARSSEVDALRRSGRARPLLLGGLAVLAAALAVWEFARPKPRGLPERRDTILVVDDAGGPDAARALRRAGFDVVTGDLADWADEADQLGIPDARLLRRILMLADERGAGYVAFELGDDDVSRGLLEDLRALPKAEGVDDVDVETTREVVVSVGDLAHPHHVTVAPPPSAVVRMGAIGLVRAAFTQPMLAPDRPSLLRRPSLEELLLAEQLDPGVRMIKRIDTLETSARRMQEEVERTMASVPDAPALHDSLSSGGVVPIAEGAAITITRRVELVSFDGDFLDLEEAPQIMVRSVRWSEDEGRARLDDVTSCTELGLHDAKDGDVVELRASNDGRTWLVVTKSSGTHVWSLDADPQGSDPSVTDDGESASAPCGFVDLGVLPEPREGTLGRGVPGPHGKVARVRDLGDGRAVVEVVTPGPSTTLVQLMEFPLLRLAEPVWIDERHLAVFGRGAEDSLGRLHQELMVMDAERPLVGLKLDLTGFVGSAKVAQVLPVVARRRRGAVMEDVEPPVVGAGTTDQASKPSTAAGLDVFLLSGKEPRQIHRIHVDLDVAAALADLDEERRRMAAAAAPAAEVRPTVRHDGSSATADPVSTTGAVTPSGAREPGAEEPGAEERGAEALATKKPEDGAVLVSLVPVERTVHDLLAARGEVWDLTIDPQHTRLAFTWQPEPSRRTVVATLPLDGVSTIRGAGRERGAERRPRFDASGRRLLFEATFPLSVMERMLIIPGLSPPVR